MKLIRQERTFIAEGDSYKPSNRIITGYGFSEMPPNQEAFINNFGGQLADSWRILRVIIGVGREWKGDFKTPDEAQAALEAELQNEAGGAPISAEGLLVHG